MEPNEKIFTLAENFSASAKILTAIGDETRQHLILEMMKMGNCMGVRVGDITKKTNLSRPAVSHHLQIMKDAGTVKVRKEGTKNYYYLVIEPFSNFDIEFAKLSLNGEEFMIKHRLDEEGAMESEKIGFDSLPDILNFDVKIKINGKEYIGEFDQI